MYIGNIYLQNITRTTFYHSDNSSGGGGGGDKRLKKSNRLQVRKNQIGSAFWQKLETIQQESIVLGKEL